MAIPPLLRATLLVGGLALAPRGVAAAECAVAREGVRCRCSPIPTIGDSASAPAMARAYSVAVRARVLPGSQWGNRRLEVLERFLGPALDTLGLVQGAHGDAALRRYDPRGPGLAPGPAVKRPAKSARPGPNIVEAPRPPDSVLTTSCDVTLPAAGTEVLVLARQVFPGVLGVWRCSGLMVPVAAAEAMLRGLRAARPELPGAP